MITSETTAGGGLMDSLKICAVTATLALGSLQAASDPTDASPAVCAGPILATQAEAEAYIRKSAHEWAASVVTRNTTALEHIFSEDFVWVVDGRVLDKKATLVIGQKDPGRYVSNVPNQITIRFYGNAAVAQGSETWTRRDGTSGTWVWTDTWISRDGCWQMVSAQDTTVPLRKE